MKEKGIFLALLLMLLASLVVSGCLKAQDEPVEATRPEWKVGYQWKSRFGPVKGETTTFSEKVVEIEDFEGISCYVVEIEQGNRPGWGGRNYYTRDLNPKAWMQHGKIKHRFDPALQWLSWPLTVGKKWKANYTETILTPMGRAEETIVEANFKVVKIEKVEVPAGEFIAFKITQKIKGRTVEEVWYSPKVKWVVKRRYYVREKRGGRWSEHELLEYKVG